MRRKKSSNEGLIIWVFIIGVPIFLMMEYPIIFWLVFVPLVTYGIVKFITWLKK